MDKIKNLKKRKNNAIEKKNYNKILRTGIGRRR
jgi:hypothetical protein